MNWKIFDADGELVNTIFASKDFVEKYCETYGFTYEAVEPDPEPEPQPTAQEDNDAMLVDHEYRLTLLELGVTSDAV